MVARHPCPHCSETFSTNPILETHIHFLHNNGASQPPRTKPLVWMPPLRTAERHEANATATSVTAVPHSSREDLSRPGNASTSAEAANAEGGDNIKYVSSLSLMEVLREASGAWAAQPALNSLSTGPRTGGNPRNTQSLRIRQEQTPVNAATTPTPPPRPQGRRPPLRSVTNSIDTPTSVRQDMRLSELPAINFERQRRRSASPDRSGILVNPQAHKFVVIYESQEMQVQQRLEVPTGTSWESFTALLQGASAPVAGAYIPGRSTGFTLEDGPWKYALVDRDFVRVDRWRVLTSNLLYRAMISELMTHSAIWSHALVCHVSLTVRQRGVGRHE